MSYLTFILYADYQKLTLMKDVTSQSYLILTAANTFIDIY